MQLEFHQLELRYERLRVMRPEAERRLMVSLAEVGQQVPIVVVQPGDQERYVVIDGYKRIRCLRRLTRDVVVANRWPGEEAEALIVTRLMQTSEGETAMEQSWLLVELKQRFGFSLEDLARRFGHSVSWVSRRLALVQELPEEVQQRVQRGEMVAHGAAKYLVPLARANREACMELVEGIGSTRLTSSDLGLLYRAYQTGNWVTRQRLLENPLLFLKSEKQAEAVGSEVESSPGGNLLNDLEVASCALRRADRRLRQGLGRNLALAERQQLGHCLEQCQHEMQRLAERFRQEVGDVGSGHPSCDSAA